MTDRELMQQALEALEFHTCGDEVDEALITALSERLAREEEIEPPMALVLADVLEQRHTIDGCNAEMQAAAELRRLHGLLGKSHALNRIRANRIKELEQEAAIRARGETK